MLNDSANDPVVVHAQVALPHAADLTLGIHAPCCVQPRRDLLGTKQVRVLGLLCLPQDSLRRGTDILVSESRAPDHSVCLEGAAVGETDTRFSVAQRLDITSHDYSAIGDELGATDVNVVTSTTLN